MSQIDRETSQLAYLASALSAAPLQYIRLLEIARKEAVQSTRMSTWLSVLESTLRSAFSSADRATEPKQQLMRVGEELAGSPDPSQKELGRALVSALHAKTR
jgi:hypothetical protein